MRSLSFVAYLLLFTSGVHAWQLPASSFTLIPRSAAGPVRPTTALAAASDTKEKDATTDAAEETTQKYGLEAGLLESMKKDDGGETAKSLLKKYGIAYLATSIPLALISFGICYALVSSGVDVAGMLDKVGIHNAATEQAGTFAIAYAAHKAASPIRFPPTVLLTPYVAKLIGKEPEEEGTESESS